MVLVDYKSNNNRLRILEMVELMGFSLITSTFFRGYYLQYANIMNLSAKESVIKSVEPCFEEAGRD